MMPKALWTVGDDLMLRHIRLIAGNIWNSLKTSFTIRSQSKWQLWRNCRMIPHNLQEKRLQIVSSLYKLWMRHSLVWVIMMILVFPSSPPVSRDDLYENYWGFKKYENYPLTAFWHATLFLPLSQVILSPFAMQLSWPRIYEALLDPPSCC